jgi:SAM-dependent methyltransferase
MEQRFTFDEVARVYRTARPDYPEALIDDVVSYAALRPRDAVLEVGCGTGQATRSFATRDYRILAIDPGAEMVHAAAESLAEFSHVEFVQATFEAWPADRTGFRLIIAAQSWHWVSPQVRFVKAAEVLSSDGTLAVFGQVPVGLPAALLDRLKQAYQRHAGIWGPPPEAWYLPAGPFKGWFDESGLFGPVTHKSYPWKWQHTTSSYTDFLRTRSDIRMLAAAKREALLEEIAAAIDDQGGAFEVDYETHLYMAHRRAPPG